MKCVALLVFFFSLSAPCIADTGCEITDFKEYERPGVELVNRFYVQVVEKCASVVIRNTGEGPRFATDIHVTAFFEEGGSKTAAVDNESDRLRKVEPGAAYSTSVCFGAGSSRIIRMVCY